MSGHFKAFKGLRNLSDESTVNGMLLIYYSFQLLNPHPKSQRRRRRRRKWRRRRTGDRFRFFCPDNGG